MTRLSIHDAPAWKALPATTSRPVYPDTQISPPLRPARLVNAPRRTAPYRPWGGLTAIVLLLTAFSFAFGLRLVGFSYFVVYGASMEPSIPVGSVIMTKPVSASGLKVGDVIAYMPAGSIHLPVTHRIIGISGDERVRQLTTKGDANSAADPAKIVLQGGTNKVVYHVPYIGYIVDFASGYLGRLFLLWVPVVLLAILSLREIWTPNADRLSRNLDESRNWLERPGRRPDTGRGQRRGSRKLDRDASASLPLPGPQP